MITPRTNNNRIYNYFRNSSLVPGALLFLSSYSYICSLDNS